MARTFKGYNGDELKVMNHQTFVSIGGVWFMADQAAEVAAYIGELSIKRAEKNWLAEYKKQKKADKWDAK